MRIFYSFRCLMGDVCLFFLLSSAFTLALQLDSLPRNVASIFRRSLPGSLAWAPAGAVGYYQPPPGPVANPPVPTESKTSSTSAHEITHELRQVATETGTTATSFRRLEPSATSTSSTAKSLASNLAKKEATIGMAGIIVPALVVILHA